MINFLGSIDNSIIKYFGKSISNDSSNSLSDSKKWSKSDSVSWLVNMKQTDGTYVPDQKNRTPLMNSYTLLSCMSNRNERFRFGQWFFRFTPITKHLWNQSENDHYLFHYHIKHRKRISHQSQMDYITVFSQ